MVSPSKGADVLSLRLCPIELGAEEILPIASFNLVRPHEQADKERFARTKPLGLRLTHSFFATVVSLQELVDFFISTRVALYR